MHHHLGVKPSVTGNSELCAVVVNATLTADLHSAPYDNSSQRREIVESPLLTQKQKQKLETLLSHLYCQAPSDNDGGAYFSRSSFEADRSTILPSLPALPSWRPEKCRRPRSALRYSSRPSSGHSSTTRPSSGTLSPYRLAQERQVYIPPSYSFGSTTRRPTSAQVCRRPASPTPRNFRIEQ